MNQVGLSRSNIRINSFNLQVALALASALVTTSYAIIRSVSYFSLL